MLLQGYKNNKRDQLEERESVEMFSAWRVEPHAHGKTIMNTEQECSLSLILCAQVLRPLKCLRWGSFQMIIKKREIEREVKIWLLLGVKCWIVALRKQQEFWQLYVQ